MVDNSPPLISKEYFMYQFYRSNLNGFINQDLNGKKLISNLVKKVVPYL